MNLIDVAALLRQGGLDAWRAWSQQEQPGLALDWLMGRGELQDVCQPLAALSGVRQDPLHHPEGTAFTHTVHVVNAMAKICRREQLGSHETFRFMLAALLHDVGKAVTTRYDPAREKWTAYGHDVAGVPIAAEWLNRLGVAATDTAWIAAMVRHHMVHCRPPEQITKKSAAKLWLRLLQEGADYGDLALVMEADARGRPPLPGGLSQAALRMGGLINETRTEVLFHA
jgi:putative nucleotidyltransferase with HDIG domain